MADRPSFYSYIDRALSNILPNYDENPLNVTGVQPLQLIKSNLTNTLGLIGALWQNYLDYQTNRLSDDIATTVDQRWTADKLAYDVGVSVISAPGASTSNTGTYYFDGYRIEIDDFLLKPVGAQPLFVPFPIKPGRIWVYLRTSNISDPGEPFAQIRVEAAGPADPATPAAQELALVGVDIDAAGVSTGNTYPAVEPAEEVVFGTRLQRWTGPTQFEGTLTAGNGAGVPITIDNVSPGIVGLVITGAGNTFGMKCEGGGGTSATFTNSSAGTTVTAIQSGVGSAVSGSNNSDTKATVQGSNAGAFSGVRGVNTGSGSGGEFVSQHLSSAALTCENIGTGGALDCSSSGAVATVVAASSGSGTAVLARNTGTGIAITANNDDATSAAFQCFNAGGGFAALAIGNARVVGTVHATTGYQGSGSAAAAFPEGATVANTKSIIGGAGTTYQAENLTANELATTKRVAFTSEQASTGDRQIHHLDGEPRWRDTSDYYLHRSAEPWGPIGSSPALASFGPLNSATQGPVVSVTLKANSDMVITAGCDISGTDASTVARIRILVNAVEVFNTVYSVPVANTDVVWSKSFVHTGTAGTFDVEIEFDRSAGIGNVNAANADIVVVPV